MGRSKMRGKISFRAIALALVVTVVGAAGIAAVAGARNADLTVTAKLSPNVVSGGEPVYYKTTLRNNKTTTTHLVFSATFPSGTTNFQTVSGAPCTLSGTDVSCDFGMVAAGVTSSVEIKAQTADVATAPWTVLAKWGFFDVRGQGGNAQSTDFVDVSRSIQVASSSDGSVDGTCLPLNTAGALSATKDGSSISMQTPGLSSGLCVPVAVQVVSANKLMSFAPTLSSDDPGSLILGFAGGKQKDTLFYSVVDGGPSTKVPLCSVTPVSATVPACEQSRGTSAGVLFINVDWTGDDPFWNL
jgi:hypothetical protein